MRVFVLGGYAAVRAGLAALVREQPGWQVIGEATPETVPPTAPAGASDPETVSVADVLLADLESRDDLALILGWLAAAQPRAGLVTLLPAARGRPRSPTPREDARLLAELAGATVEADLAFAALRRDATSREIVEAIQAVGGGLVALDRRLAGSVLAAAGRFPATDEAPSGVEEPLTPRELEVLQLLAQGLPNKTIARQLHISEHTAKFHVSAIMVKLGAASRTEAVTRAARRGLLVL